MVGMVYNYPKKCPRCEKPTIKCHGEGYSTIKGEHEPFVLGRVCRHCKFIYLNIEMKADFDIEWSKVGT